MQNPEQNIFGILAEYLWHCRSRRTVRRGENRTGGKPGELFCVSVRLIRRRWVVKPPCKLPVTDLGWPLTRLLGRGERDAWGQPQPREDPVLGRRFVL
eukprot:1104698-Prorocentrum_minimum.AAC.1